MATPSIWTDTFTPTTPVTSTGGLNGWYVDTSGNLYEFNYDLDSWVQLYVPIIFVQLQSGSDGSLLGLSDDGIMYLLAPHSMWESLYITDNPITDISIGDSNDITVVDTYGNIYQYSYGIASTDLPSGVTQVSTSSGFEQIWSLDSSGNVYVYDSVNDEWDSVLGQTLTSIDVSTYDSTVVVLGIDYSGNGWSYISGSWKQVTSPDGGSFVTLSYNNGYFWALTTNGNLYVGY
jgi:hypothetical protein